MENTQKPDGQYLQVPSQMSAADFEITPLQKTLSDLVVKREICADRSRICAALYEAVARCRTPLSCCLLSRCRVAAVKTNCWAKLTETKCHSVPLPEPPAQTRLVISGWLARCCCIMGVSGPFWPPSVCPLNGCQGQSGRSSNEALQDEISRGCGKSSPPVSSGFLRQSGGQSENTAVYSQ